jgi:hypothetical protein
MQQKNRKTVATSLSLGLVERLHFESARTGKPIRTLIEGALERVIPKDIRVVVGKARRSTSVSTQPNE